VDESRFRCALVAPDGASRRVGPQGLLIGREHDCDVLISDPAVSRRHALIRIVHDGIELVPLGRLPIMLNGKPCEHTHALADGDRVMVSNQVFVVQIELPKPGKQRGGYRLVCGTSNFGISHTPFHIGGAATDDLILASWPASALRFHLAQGELFVEVMSGIATKSGQPIEAGSLEPIDVGDEIGYLDEVFQIDMVQDRANTTVAVAIHALPSKVLVEMLPRGGRVVFTLPTGEYTVYLADRRLDLITTLLKPPAGFVAGDFVPDDVLRPVVWPRNPTVIRSEINVHITRCRRDLLAAGLAGPRLLQRSPGGGGTRLALAKGCEIIFV
jgi:hypothetical protein